MPTSARTPNAPRSIASARDGDKPRRRLCPGAAEQSADTCGYIAHVNESQHGTDSPALRGDPKRSPARVVYSLVLFHVALWTLVPLAVNRNLPLDTIEALAWGHEWQWGYDKHPPLSAWLPEIAAIVGFRTDLGLYLLSQVFVAITLLTVYRLAREILREALGGESDADAAAMVATLVLEGIFYFNYTTPEFNVNVIQMPLWALGAFFFWRATRTGSLGAWAGLGVCAALAALSKYLGLVMLAPMAAYAIWSPHRRKIFGSAGPYLAAAVCLLMLTPHLLWMSQHEFKTLTYGLRRAAAGEVTALKRVTEPLKLAAGQATITGGAVVLFLFARPVRRGKGNDEPASHGSARQARLFALMMAAGPVLTLVAVSLTTGMRIRTMWAAPMLSMTGVALAAHFPLTATARQLKQFTWIVLGMLCFSAVMYGGVASWGDRQSSDHRTNFPGPRLAAAITSQWHDRYAAPLPIVIGDEWYAGSVAWYSPDRPRVFLDGDPERSPWLDDESVRRHGAVIVWVAVDEQGRRTALNEAFPNDLSKRFEIADTLVFNVDWRPREGSQNVVLHAALVPPAGKAARPK